MERGHCLAQLSNVWMVDERQPHAVDTLTNCLRAALKAPPSRAPVTISSQRSRQCCCLDSTGCPNRIFIKRLNFNANDFDLKTI